MAASVPIFTPQNINKIEAESITLELPICSGYLDKTLDIFRRHKHPIHSSQHSSDDMVWCQQPGTGRD